MYKIKAMDIKNYDEIINLWKNTDGVGLSGSDDSKKSIKLFLDKNPNTCFVAEYKNEIIIFHKPPAMPVRIEKAMPCPALYDC